MTETWLEPYVDRLERFSGRFYRFFHSRVDAEGGLSPSQHYTLRVLKDVGCCTVSDLAQKLDMTTAGATGLVDRLVKANLVRRSRDESDRRVVHVSLKEEGDQALTAACGLRRKVLAELLRVLTPEEAEQLIKLQEKMAQAFMGTGT